MTPATLTPAEATQIVTNGGLVVDNNNKPYAHLNPHDLVYRGFYPHPLYDPSTFALTFPCTLTGPEARALLMAAPVGMLEGCYESDTGDETDWDRYAEFWDGQQFVSKHFQPYKWREQSNFEIRLHPSWLESQRAKFARGEFGEPNAIQRAVAGMVSTSTKRAPQPGDVVDEPIANRLCRSGWEVKSNYKYTTVTLKLVGDEIHSFVEADGRDQGQASLDEDKGSFTLLRHEPWRTSTLATGYVWSGQDAAQALRAGMEAKIQGWDGLLHATGNVVWNDKGDECNALTETVESYFDSYPRGTNWALRWPAKENAKMSHELDMMAEAVDETLTAGQALDLLAENEKVIGNCGRQYGLNESGCETERLYVFMRDAPFRRVPKRPTSKPLTLDNGLTVTVYANRVVADVPGCATYIVQKRQGEVALRLHGLIGEHVPTFAVMQNSKVVFDAVVTTGGVTCNGRTITFTDIRNCLDAMSKLGGGE